MVVVDFDELIDVDDLPDEILEATPSEAENEYSESESVLESNLNEDRKLLVGRSANGAIVGASPELENSLKPFVGLTLEELERLFIQETLRSTGGNREETAKILGVGERTLYRRIKQFSQENKEAVSDAK